MAKKTTKPTLYGGPVTEANRVAVEQTVKDAFKPGPVQPEAQQKQTGAVPIPGSYSKERGGFVTTEGRLYPTTNPDFVPTQTDSGTKFNPDGSVEVTRNGTKEVFPDRNAYQNFLDVETGKGGNLTNQVQTLQNAPTVSQERAAQLMDMVQQGVLTPEELGTITGNKIDIGQAIGAGFSNILPALIGGATAGAAIGGTATAPAGGAGAIPGAAIGAAGGAITGFLNGVKNNIKNQQSDSFAADQQALVKGEKYLKALITDTNKYPGNAAENSALFYQTLNNIEAAHQRTWKDSQEDLNKFLGNDGTVQLAKFEIFNNNMKDYYIRQFNQALLNPDVTKSLITVEDLQSEE